MRPGDRLVCAFVEPQPVGTRFTDWLLHVTIVPWFRLGTGSAALAADLQRALAGVGPFDVRIAGTEPFGHKGRRTASVPADPAPFAESEKRVRALLKAQNAWLIDETTKQRWPYRPHVTFQKSGHLNPGDGFHCDRLYLIEQNGDHKEVAAMIPFSSAASQAA